MSFMTEHVSKSLIAQFLDRSLDVSTLVSISTHLESCVECYEMFRETFKVKRETVTEWSSLSSSDWLREEHLEYEEIIAYVDGPLDGEDREILDEHLKLCGRCRGDLESFVIHRQHIEPELNLRYSPSQKQSERRYFKDLWESFKIQLKPAYAAYAVLSLISLVSIAILLRNPTESPSHSDSPIAIVTPSISPTVSPKPGSTPSESSKSSGSSGLSSSALPDNNPGKTGDRLQPDLENSVGAEIKNLSESHKLVISLHDGRRQIALYDSGRISGLEDLSDSDRKLVQETLSSGELQRPAILDEFVAGTSVTRSKGADQASFKLISPGQVVISENKPVFKWEPLKGAVGYKVYIASKSNWAGMASPALGSSTLEWIPPTPLRRGETYTWAVTAITEKGDLIAPAPYEPERKFKVLGERDLNALVRLKRQTTSHLALGLYYLRSGLISDAEKEFQLLVNENADSAFATKLLDQARSFR